MQQLRLWLLTLGAVTLMGCSSLPDSLKSANPEVQSDYQTWAASDPQQATELRLGGVIAGLENQEGRSRIEIVQLPINSSSGKPDINVEPEGRFVAYIDGFLDPVTYAKGRLITVLGFSAGSETGRVGEYEYRFPVMNARGHQLWKIRERVNMHHAPVGHFRCKSLYCRELNYPTSGTVYQEVVE